MKKHRRMKIQRQVYAALSLIFFSAAALIAGYSGDKLWVMVVGEGIAISGLVLSLGKGGFFVARYERCSICGKVWQVTWYINLLGKKYICPHCDKKRHPKAFKGNPVQAGMNGK